MKSAHRPWLLVACSAAGLGAPLVLGLTYSDRLSSPEGFYQVEVADAAVPELRRPRRTALVVLDGLGYEEARTMRSLAELQARGQCRRTDVGSLTLSRPVYAVLSTGLEQDRTGARGNDDARPIAAQSIWEIARAAGLSVAAVSELPWWRELFPGGFDRYETAARELNYFERVPPADLQLVHPLYIDEAGHESGADSPEYRAAVARADAELSGFLKTMDLSRDLVVVTADHGHSLRGGHGGRQDRVAHVLTCHAGVGVRHVEAPGELQSISIAPSLALLLGLRFPATMRAGDDDLEALWQIADPGAFPPGYLEARRAAVARFRGRNADQLRAWLPESEGSWDRFYAWHRARQRWASLPFWVALALLLGLQSDAQRRRARGAVFGPVFVVLCGCVAFALQVALRGSFDLSSVAHREDFIGFTVALSFAWTAAAIGGHWLLRRDLDALLLDLSALSLVGTLASLAHPAVFGWQLGFPVPPPALYFFPYFAAILLGVLNGAGLLLGVVTWVVRRRRA